MKKFELPELGYAYDALEPYIDEETMRIHHDRHHQTYTDNLNKALEGLELEIHCAGDLLTKLDKIPAEKRDAVRNNGGGYFNHNLFWKTMQPGGAKEPSGALLEAINEHFGSFESFKEQFEAAGAAQFGSGWVCLVKDGDKLEIVKKPNQDSPVSDGKRVLLLNDVWEHAYYLKYQNKRADYLKAWWNVVNWDVVTERFERVHP